MLGAVPQRCPVHHGVMPGDRLRSLAAMKRHLHERLTTVLPCHGRSGPHGFDPHHVANHPPTSR